MIRAQGLTKYYERRCVVRELSFSIADREIVGFLGLNGAGKTTVLRMLAGLLTPSSGNIEIDSHDLLADPLSMRWRIGFLPERPPLYDEMTVRAYLGFAAKLRGYADEKVSKRVGDVLTLCALDSYADEPIVNLSHGFRQRAGIAQAIVHEPSLVILDEPISGLDSAQIVEMRKLILALKDRHTVLLSSHILNEISQTCDRLLIIKAGQLVEQGTEAELAERMSGNRRQLLLEVKGERAQIEAALQGNAVITSFQIRSSRDSIHELHVELAEPRPEVLAQLVVSKGLSLRRLEPMKSELEAMFLQLTGARS